MGGECFSLPRRAKLAPNSCKPPLRIHLLQQPRHVPSQHFHGADAFLVFFHLAGFPPNPDVPVGRARYDHLADQEEVVEGIECVHGPALRTAITPAPTLRRNMPPLAPPTMQARSISALISGETSAT